MSSCKTAMLCVLVCFMLVVLPREGGVAQQENPEATTVEPYEDFNIETASNDTNMTTIIPMANTTVTNFTTIEPFSNTTTMNMTTIAPFTNTTMMNMTTIIPFTNTTTMNMTTIPSNGSSTTSMMTTVSPLTTAAPPTGFSVGSFFGGIVLGAVVAVICVMLVKIYLQRRHGNPYQTV